MAAPEELGLDAEVETVTDPGEIAGYGVMKIPGLGIDDSVVLSGTVANQKEIVAPLRAAAS